MQRNGRSQEASSLFVGVLENVRETKSTTGECVNMISVIHETIQLKYSKTMLTARVDHCGCQRT